MATETPGYSHARMFTVLLVGVAALSLLGFAVGTRSANVPRGPEVKAQPPRQTNALASLPYARLRERRHSGATPLSSDLRRLRVGMPGMKDAVPRSPELRAAAVAARARRRAYDGAPPTVPHAIDEKGADGCLACHGEGVAVEGKIAPKISHAELTNCTQCHVASRSTRPSTLDVPNAFVGLTSPGPGKRAWTGAPPTIPHQTWMRENCDSCHGLSGKVGLRTTHPYRLSCVQCHAPGGGALPWRRRR